MHYVSINQCLLVPNSKILSITLFVALTRLVIDYWLLSNHCDYCAQFHLAVGKIEKKIDHQERLFLVVNITAVTFYLSQYHIICYVQWVIYDCSFVQRVLYFPDSYTAVFCIISRCCSAYGIFSSMKARLPYLKLHWE